jgi:hypothetical protein
MASQGGDADLYRKPAYNNLHGTGVRHGTGVSAKAPTPIDTPTLVDRNHVAWDQSKALKRQLWSTQETLHHESS